MPDLSLISRFSVYRAISECRSEDEIKEFIKDLLTSTEIENIEDRWSIAQSKLATNCSKNAARAYHKASQDLVDKVFGELSSPEDTGYRLIFRRLSELSETEAT